MDRFYTYSDLKAYGVPYSRQHIRRLEKEGKIPPMHRRAPGCKPLFTDKHVAALTGKTREAQGA